MNAITPPRCLVDAAPCRRRRRFSPRRCQLHGALRFTLPPSRLFSR
jgi:hypothetical protein